jgi:hypothetical protein
MLEFFSAVHGQEAQGIKAEMMLERWRVVCLRDLVWYWKQIRGLGYGSRQARGMVCLEFLGHLEFSGVFPLWF